jgi:hypothetical protein
MIQEPDHSMNRAERQQRRQQRQDARQLYPESASAGVHRMCDRRTPRAAWAMMTAVNASITTSMSTCGQKETDGTCPPSITATMRAAMSRAWPCTKPVLAMTATPQPVSVSSSCCAVEVNKSPLCDLGASPEGEPRLDRARRL